MEAVAPGNHVATELDLLAVLLKENARGRGIDVAQRDRFDLEEELAIGSDSRLNQILDDLLLTIDRDRFPA